LGLWYTSNTDDLSRINELKKIISEFHKKGIKVTFDVVFNHTFEGSRKTPNIYLFRGIDSDHYYRSQADESFYDGIYCQNELNTENPMVAKYIIDCLKYWVTEFKADGFRFDWMSAIDPVTMTNIIKTLRNINPNVLLYGELWTLRGLSYMGKNTGTYIDRQHIGLYEKDFNLPWGSIAGFNDYFRDAVKGSGFMRDFAGGYIQNTVNERYYPSSSNGHLPYELVRKTIKGMIGYTPRDDDKTEWQEINSPLNSINYIDCHDGYTLFDKLIIGEYCNYIEPGKSGSSRKTYPQSETNSNVVDLKDNTIFSAEDEFGRLKKMNNLGAAILLTSQGIPFIHAGQEILRQKINYIKTENSSRGLFVFDPNSNTSSDKVNAIKWSDKEKNYDVFKYYQGLIELRKEHPTFKRKTKESVENGLIFYDEWLPKNGERCIAYNLVDPKNDIRNEKWKNVIVLINPYPDPKTFTIPKGEWKIVVNAEKAGVKTINEIVGEKVDVAGVSMTVLYK
jgi:pullulanase